MKQLVRKIEEHVNLYRDDKTGIAWIEDGRIGIGISVHANITSSGNISGMKALGIGERKIGQSEVTDGFITLIALSVIRRMNWK